MVCKLKRVNGVLKIDVDGVAYEPLSFKSFRPTPENISDFANAGVKFMSILISGRNCAYGIPYSLYGESWFGIDKYDLGVIDSQIDMFIKSAPDCYFALMIDINTREWWHETHENFPNSYGWLSQMLYDSEWREETSKYIQTVISHVEEKYGDKFYGYYLLCGNGTEWLSWYDYQGSHPIKDKYYKDYTNNPDAVIPSKDRLELDEDISFYNDDEVRLYNKAHAELTADTILYFAKKVNQITNHNKLVGVYFGYVFELNGAGLWNNGHQAYEKVFNSEEIDIISSPASYQYRATDSVSAFMVAHKAMDINNKLYYFEFDQRTYRSQTFLEGVEIPPAGYCCKDDMETLNLMRRDFLLCAANGASLWWFDMWNGWYSSDVMLKGIKQMIDISKEMSPKEQKSVSEIAVIVSGEAFYGVNKNAGINTKLLSKQRDGLARIGAPYDVYSLGNLPRIDISQYKLFVFLTAFETTPAEDLVIDKIKKSGKSILWGYAPRYINGGIKAVEEAVDMNMSIMDTKPEYSGEYGVVMSAPYLYVNDDNAKTLVEYDNKISAISYKDCGNYMSFYSSLGNMSGELLRKIAKLCKVHIYCENAPVYVNSQFIGVYATDDVWINVKEDGIYEDMFSKKEYKSQNGKLYIPKDEHMSKMLVKK